MRNDLVPMSLGDIFDEAFDLYKHNFTLLAGIVAALYVPAHIVWLVLYYGLGIDRLTAVEGDASAQVLAVLLLMLVYCVVGLLYTFLAVVQNGALAIGVSERFLDRPMGIADAYRRTVPHLGRLLATWAIVFLGAGAAVAVLMSIGSVGLAFFAAAAAGMGGGGEWVAMIGVAGLTVLCVLGALFVATWLGAFVTQAVVVEGKGLGAALSRNTELLKGRLWRTVGAGALIALISTAMLTAFYFSAGAVLEYLVYAWLFVPPVVQSTISGAISGCLWVLLQPFWMICLTLLYYDHRVRREGFDLALLETQLVAAAGGRPR